MLFLSINIHYYHCLIPECGGWKEHFLSTLDLFVLANYCFQGGLVFYNALLPQISTPGTMGKISGYGVALGYMGAIVGMVLVMPFNEGSVFGLEIPFIPGNGRGATFVPTGLLFLVCSVPTFLFLRKSRCSHLQPCEESRDQCSPFLNCPAIH